MSEKFTVKAGELAAVARPGDTIVIGVKAVLSDAELADMEEAFEGFTDTTGVHVALVENVVGMVVTRGEEAE